MANSYNKNFVRQVMMLEMDRLILKKTNEKIAQTAEARAEQQKLESIKTQLIAAERTMESNKQTYKNPPSYQPHGLIYNFFHKSDMPKLADWIISLFTIVFWTALGLAAGYWGLGRFSDEMGVAIFVSMIFSFIGLHIGGKIVEESCRDCLLAIWFMELYWASSGFFMGYRGIGRYILPVSGIEVGLGIQILLGVVFAGIGFFIGWLHRILVELDDWFDNPFNFTTLKQDIAYANRLHSIYKAEYEASVKRYEELKKQQSSSLQAYPKLNRIKKILSVLAKYWRVTMIGILFLQITER